MGFPAQLRKFATQFKKYATGNGGCECLECGFYSEGSEVDWYDGGKVTLGSQALSRVCPQCGSEKTMSGIFVTRVDTGQKT